MKAKILILLILLFSHGMYAKKWIISNSGFSFTPSTLTINLGDTVEFAIADNHQVREVSESDWNLGNSVGLPGGFETGNGGGIVLPDKLGSGTHYYVCVPHAANGMKGRIIVAISTGLEKLTSENFIGVFPNPAHDYFSIKLKNWQNKLNYILLDSFGKIMLKGTVDSNSERINISHLSSGVYYIVLEGDVKRIIKIQNL